MSAPLIDLVVGTRPEVIKLRPVYRELLRRPAAGLPRVISTGQSPGLLAQHGEGLPVTFTLPLPPEVERRAPDELGVLLAPMLRELTSWWRASRPDLVMVQGDTLSALAGALVAVQEGLPVVHVEAGLRSGRLDRPYPEEVCRRLIAELTSLHCAPTPKAAETLKREQVRGRILMTGNPGVDALYFDGRGLPFAQAPPNPFVLVTCHRREGWDEILPGLVAALGELAVHGLAKRFDIVWPLHPNPHILNAVAPLQTCPGVTLLPAVPRRAFLELLSRAGVVLTDSGGVIEEAITLGIPTIILREETERPEALDCGVGVLCPLADIPRLPEIVLPLLDGRARVSRTCFGEGHAAEHIVDGLLSQKYFAAWGLGAAQAFLPHRGATDLTGRSRL